VSESPDFRQRLAGRLPGLSRVTARLARVPVDPAALIMRIGMAIVFWRSGMTKIASWSSTLLLFKNEYRVPFLPAELAAYLATGVELAAPIMLVLGAGTRLAALAMLAMALVIQLFVYPKHYPDHLLWIGILLYLFARGPGAYSLDHLLRLRLLGAR